MTFTAPTKAEQPTEITVLNHSKTVTLGSADTASAPIQLGGMCLAKVITPGTLTATTINLYGCDTISGTYVPIKDRDGNAISLTVSTNEGINIHPEETYGWNFIKLNVTSSEGSDRVFTYSLRTVQ